MQVRAAKALFYVIMHKAHWQLSKEGLLTSITWSYRGLKCRTHRAHFFKFTADQVMDFHQIEGSSIEAPLLGLAKSIYYIHSDSD